MPQVRITSHTKAVVSLGEAFGTLAPYEELVVDADVSDLEAASETLAHLQKQGLIRWHVEQNGGQSDAVEFFPSTASLTRLSQPLHLYVSEANGSDSNDGRSPGTAFATYTRAAEEVNKWDVIAYHENSPGATIHLASGTYEFAEIGPVLLEGALLIIGDGAGQPGDDGFTELRPATVITSATEFSVTVAGAGWTKNELTGFTVEFTTGALAGYRRSVIRNTADTFYLSGEALASAGDEFRLLEPAVQLDVNTTAWQAPENPKAILRASGTPQYTVFTIHSQFPKFPLITRPAVVNIHFHCTGQDEGIFRTGVLDVSGMIAYGVHITKHDNTLFYVTGNGVLSGMDDSDGFNANIVMSRWSLVSNTNAWLCWGIRAESTMLEYIRSFVGTLCYAGRDLTLSGNWKFRGGAVVDRNQEVFNAALAVRQGAYVSSYYAGGDQGQFYVYTGKDGRPAVETWAGATLELVDAIIEKANSGPAVAAIQTDSGQGAESTKIIFSGGEIVGITDVSQPNSALEILAGGNISMRAPAISGFQRDAVVRVAGSFSAQAVQELNGGRLGDVHGTSFPTPEQGREFVADGPLSGYTDGVAGTLSLTAAFGGAHQIRFKGLLDELALTQIVDGTAGNTTVELYRRRASAATLVASVSLAFGGGDVAHATTSLVEIDPVLRVVEPGDQLFAQFTERQTGGSGVTVHLKSGAGAHFGLIMVL